jgi:hypothetical protein
VSIKNKLVAGFALGAIASCTSPNIIQITGAPELPQPGCVVMSPQPLPSPLPASGFTFDIATFQDPVHPINGGLGAYKGPDLQVAAFGRDHLSVYLTSESYLPGVLSRYNGSVMSQISAMGGITEVNGQTGVSTLTPAAGHCPTYLIKMNDLDNLDLSDLPDWAGKMGLSGHFTFLDHASAALFKRSLQIRFENPTIVSYSGLDFANYPD